MCEQKQPQSSIFIQQDTFTLLTQFLRFGKCISLRAVNLGQGEESSYFVNESLLCEIILWNKSISDSRVEAGEDRQCYTWELKYCIFRKVASAFNCKSSFFFVALVSMEAYAGLTK